MFLFVRTGFSNGLGFFFNFKKVLESVFNKILDVLWNIGSLCLCSYYCFYNFLYCGFGN